MKDSGLNIEDISSPEGFRMLPILTKRDIQLEGDRLHCTETPAGHGGHIDARTSGSTGEPTTTRKTAINHLFWQANMLREHIWHKRDFTGKLLNIRSTITESVPNNNWGDPVNFLFKSGPSLGISTSLGAKGLINEIIKFKPDNMICYPNTLDSIVIACEQENIKIEGVKHIWSIGETLSYTLRERATKLFNASVENNYSSNEIGIMALQCPESGLYHIMSESILLEVLDEKGEQCREGEMGKVVVTSLHNFATPLIRYDIGDYVEVGGICPCGRGLPTIKQINGRKRNLVLKPDGTRHWPPLTLQIFRSKLPIYQFQLLHNTAENIEVRLVTKTKFTKKDEKLLTKHLHIALGHSFNLNFVYFDDRLPLPKSGKFEDFVSYI